MVLSIRDFLFHFIKTSHRVSTLDSSDEEEEVMSTTATNENNSPRKNSASFYQKRVSNIFSRLVVELKVGNLGM